MTTGKKACDAVKKVMKDKKSSAPEKMVAKSVLKQPKK